jgi:hypothetical protein
MHEDFVFGHTCFCGRSFTRLASFQKHQNACKRSRTRLSLAVEMAKENVTRKLNVAAPGVRRKLEDLDQNVPPSTLGVEEGNGQEVSGA